MHNKFFQKKLKKREDVKFASPLQGAVIADDFNRIQILVDLGYDINEIDRLLTVFISICNNAFVSSISGRSAIHEAVVRGYSNLVDQMCTNYAVRSADHKIYNSTDERIKLDDVLNLEKERDFQVMKLDICDNNGETIFHIASR